ncbi:DsbC family protein [Algiphilus sp.]|uniref:DsbC family protein n=1 Tax=Algiphilus sp. TaxID=1872431 RepID=UPI003B525AC0
MRSILTPLLFASGFFMTACGASESTNQEATAQDAGASTAATQESAAPASGEENAELQAVRDKLAERIPDLASSELRPTPLEDIYELSRGMAVGYVTADGRYLIEGDLVDLATGRQITEERRREARLEVLEDAAARSISFGADDAEYLVTVFTDIDCGYCRKLHDEIGEYNERGIAIRYLLYPRSGQNSVSYRKAVATWCSEDRQQTLTEAKQGVDPGSKSCSDHPVDNHLLAGRKLGLRGTPMMVLPNGEVVQGYVPADRLLTRLETDPAQDPLAVR